MKTLSRFRRTLAWCLASLHAFSLLPPLWAQAASSPSAISQSAGLAGQTGRALAPVSPELGKELQLLEKQIQGLLTNVKAVDANIKPVAQSATKLVQTVESYPAQVDAFKAKYDIPKNPTLQQEVQGIGRYLRDRAGITPDQTARMSQAIQRSPVFEQFKQPFQPQNLMLAVGATAGMHVLNQLKSGEGVDFGKALGFLGEGSFWGGMVGSGVGYGVMAAVATAFFPPGAGLIPVLAPMFAGLTGSIFGWELGAGLFSGQGLSESLSQLSPTRVLGQAAGSTVGLLVGANLGVALGGVLGSFGGPLGAVVGSVMLGKIGAQVGTAVSQLFQGDASAVNQGLDDALKAIQKIQNVEKGLAGISTPALPAASLTGDGLPEKLKEEYDQAYQDMAEALQNQDRATAGLKLRYLKALQARYEAAVGERIQHLSKASSP